MNLPFAQNEPDDAAMLRLGVDQFNAGAYFACHESLEGLWLKEPGRIRNLYKGILQIAVALHHRERGNRRGAVRLLESGRLLVEPFLPARLGLDLERLHRQSGEVLKLLVSGREVPAVLIPRIHFINALHDRP